MTISHQERLDNQEWYAKDSIVNMSSAIMKDFGPKEVNLVNIIKSTFRDDKLTLHGIKEERMNAKKVFDLTRLFDLGLLGIFINEHGKDLGRLRRSKQRFPSVFEGAVVNTFREASCLPENANEHCKVRLAAIADAVRLFAKSDIQFVNDYDEKDLRFRWQGGWI